MELNFKISTDESMTLAEAKELTELSEARKLTPSELAIDFIREGLRREREAAPAQSPDRTR
jgi:hypothetical protein